MPSQVKYSSLNFLMLGQVERVSAAVVWVPLMGVGGFQLPAVVEVEPKHQLLALVPSSVHVGQFGTLIGSRRVELVMVVIA